ncbi:MAG: phytanoyl-CoA dioxygenase family protein, partial [Candidatus Eremiobacteraeota bacterium]|nr:phytanoyl-CoA dioxygenase family protein [Candidatus Eremiobacteraeota bacterium]
GMYAFFRSLALLELAEAFLGTPELSVHGICNARAQLPHDESITRTPFHQDSQFWFLDYGGDGKDDPLASHVLTLWMPLQRVCAQTGGLAVIPRTQTGRRVFERYDFDYERTGFYGLAPDELARFVPETPELEPGDLLAFDHLAPHGAAEHRGDRLRWSIDVRYEATAAATGTGKKFGFVAQSLANPGSVTPLGTWLRKRA